MIRPLVILTDGTDLDSRPARRILETAGFDVCALDLDNGRVPERARRAVGAVVGWTRMDDWMLGQLPALRVIATTSTGVDMIDLDAAARHGVDVVPLAGAATREVATHALALMLAVLRGIPQGVEVVSDGGWTEDSAFIPRALEDLTLGLLGYGRIARDLARLASPLFGSIIAFDPYASVQEPAEAVEIEELWRRSDVMSLHVPLSNDTRRIASAARIALLPVGAILLNVSRAPLVDEEAVLSALESGRLAAYAADVLDGEPPVVEHPLRRHPRALMTPHVAYRSDRSLARYQGDPARNVIAGLTDPLPPDAD